MNPKRCVELVGGPHDGHRCSRLPLPVIWIGVWGRPRAAFYEDSGRRSETGHLIYCFTGRIERKPARRSI